MFDLVAIFSDPANIAALATLIAIVVVLGIDNLIFISILTNKLPEHQRSTARRVGQKKAVAIAVRNASQRLRWSKLREWLAVGAAAFGSDILAMTHSGHHLADV